MQSGQDVTGRDFGSQPIVPPRLVSISDYEAGPGETVSVTVDLSDGAISVLGLETVLLNEGNLPVPES